MPCPPLRPNYKNEKTAVKGFSQEFRLNFAFAPHIPLKTELAMKEQYLRMANSLKLEIAISSLQNRRYFFAAFFRRARASARRARSARHARREGAKKITPVRQPLFMLLRRSYMNAAIQLVILCHVIMACYSTTKIDVASSCSVDEAIREVTFVYFQICQT